MRPITQHMYYVCGQFCPWDVLSLGCAAPWNFLSLEPYVSYDLMSLRRFVPWDVLTWNVFSVHLGFDFS